MPAKLATVNDHIWALMEEAGAIPGGSVQSIAAGARRVWWPYGAFCRGAENG